MSLYGWNCIFGYGDQVDQVATEDRATLVREIVNTIILAVIFFVLMFIA